MGAAYLLSTCDCQVDSTVNIRQYLSTDRLNSPGAGLDCRLSRDVRGRQGRETSPAQPRLCKKVKVKTSDEVQGPSHPPPFAYGYQPAMRVLWCRGSRGYRVDGRGRVVKAESALSTHVEHVSTEAQRLKNGLKN